MINKKVHTFWQETCFKGLSKACILFHFIYQSQLTTANVQLLEYNTDASVNIIGFSMATSPY